MSSSSFLLVLVLLFASLVSAEVIVYDNFGDSVSLPLSGGNATGGFMILTPLIATSPYILSITVNDIIEPGYTVNASESFFVSPAFSSSSLTSATYQAFTNPGGVPFGPITNTTLGTRGVPNKAIGLYTYTFRIPTNGNLTVNVTYNNTANPVLVDQIYILVVNPPTRVVGDPQFIGLRGQSYQVHGIDGAVYNLISEKNTQVNARFTFLDQGRCPIINGVAATNCWSHPGSYLGEMSFQQIVDGIIHTALVTAGPASSGFAQVQVDGGKAMAVGESVSYGSFSISYESRYTLIVTTEHFYFEITNSDMFVNQLVKATVALSKLNAHGLFGQTHSNKVYPTSIRYVAGDVDDYVVGDDDIFGNEFVFNQFQQDITTL